MFLLFKIIQICLTGPKSSFFSIWVFSAWACLAY